MIAKRHKVGDTLYMISAEADGTPKTELWVVRTIRGGKVTAIWKLPSTWGKRSTKRGDIGWRDPIPAWCRKTWQEGKPIPLWYSLFTTKRQAIRDALRDFEADDFDTPEAAERFKAKVARMKP